MDDNERLAKWLRTIGDTDEWSSQEVANFRRAADLLDRQRWRPIETAPKDGQVIEGWIGRPWFFSWQEIESGYAPHGVVPIQGGWGLMWLRDTTPNQPTHWRPLPEPPEDEQC